MFGKRFGLGEFGLYDDRQLMEARLAEYIERPAAWPHRLVLVGSTVVVVQMKASDGRRYRLDEFRRAEA